MSEIPEKSEKPVKIDKWDTSALKNALDDEAKLVMKETLGFVESHKLMDGRLIICTVAVGFALFALAWDYLMPFPKSRNVLITCSLSYFAMMGLLTLYTMFIEAGCFMIALEKDKTGVDPDDTWNLISKLKRFDDMYEFTMTFKSGRTGVKRQSSFTKSVSCFFDDEGNICHNIFRKEVLSLQNSLGRNRKLQ